jgi:hypothetical protein
MIAVKLAVVGIVRRWQICCDLGESRGDCFYCSPTLQSIGSKMPASREKEARGERKSRELKIYFHINEVAGKKPWVAFGEFIKFIGTIALVKFAQTLFSSPNESRCGEYMYN